MDHISISSINAAQRRTVAFGTVAQSPTAYAVRDALVVAGYDVIDASEISDDRPTWPSVGHHVASLVADHHADTGVALCWTGSGVAISASTIPHIRAAFSSSPSEAADARHWHDANVLALSLSASPTEAVATLQAWLASKPLADAGHVAARTDLNRLASASAVD
jgi:ribose 5-phosphate isomerase B